MTAVELAWQNYSRANERIDRARAANDATGLAIAEASARHWHEVWQMADAAATRAGVAPRTASPASAPHGLRSRIATAAANAC